jgi:hypothetical protein
VVFADETGEVEVLIECADTVDETLVVEECLLRKELKGD